MKWLFFALLALNIAIFGGMTLPKVMEKQEAEMMAKKKEASARMTRDSADLPQPMVKPSDAGAFETLASAVASVPSGNWLTDNGGAADVYILSHILLDYFQLVQSSREFHEEYFLDRF